MLPLHPLRILWLAEYDRKIRSWAQSYTTLRDRGDNPQIDLEMIGRIQPTNLPFVMPLKPEKFCVYLDEIAFGCGFYLPLDGKDFQKSARMIEDALAAQGSNFISTIRAELLTKRVGKFVESHSDNETLSVIAVNPGSGEVLSIALSEFLRFDEDEQKQFLDFRFEIKIYGDDFPFSKPVQHLQVLQETIRGAHPVGPVNHLMPPMGLAVRNRDQLEIDGDLLKIKSCVKLTGFVNSTEDYIEQPKVINGASDLIASIFGEAGMHTRAAVSTNSLPLGVSVEVDAIFELK